MASLMWDGEVGMSIKVRRWEGKGEGVEGEDLEGVGLYKETNIYIPYMVPGQYFKNVCHFRRSPEQSV